MHWRLSDSSALGSVAESQFEVFPQSPKRASRLICTKRQVAWQIAQVTAQPHHASQPEEVYSRQGDLIARYRQSEQDSFAYQLDWRLLQPSEPFVAEIELWLSIQTELLDTQPQLEVSSLSWPGSTWRILDYDNLIEDGDFPGEGGPAALVCQSESPDTAGGQLTGLWMTDPSDLCHTQLMTNASQSTQQVRLFGQFMEKGVIRRARMRFLLASQPLTLPQIAAAYQRLADSPLPLTT